MAHALHALTMQHACCRPTSCRAIAVLGVDFMSENVRAILDEAGHKDVAVYRMAAGVLM